jgi:beta propeller repeat protein
MCPLGCQDGACIEQEIICGDGTCDAGETCQSCESDCGSCVIPTCTDGTLIGECSESKPKYCNTEEILIDDCQTCVCFSGYDCQVGGSCTVSTIPIGPNTKSESLYSNKEVFLISDKDWKNVLPFVPVAVWTEGGTINKYPFLIYHDDYYSYTLHDTLLDTGQVYNGNYDIENNLIVYQASGGIYTYNILTSEKKNINPQGSNRIKLSNNKIIWFTIVWGAEGADNSFEIYLYDILTETTEKILTNENNFLRLSFFGNNIAWAEEVGSMDVGGGWSRSISDVYLYDISTQTQTKIAENAISVDYISISDSYIVWGDFADNLFYLNIYDISTQQTTKIEKPNYPNSISLDGVKVVWSDWRNGNANVFLYDILTGEETQITTDPVNDLEPKISGEKIVWGRGGNIYMYDLVEQRETEVAGSLSYESYARISGENILFCKDSCNEGISMYDPTINDVYESFNFDADSIIYFMQQYSPDKVTIIGETPLDLDNLLITGPELGAGLQGKIQRINDYDYLSYWESFDKVVYVEENYELALLASTYASLINAPLIIQGTAHDLADIFSGRNIICVGEVILVGSSCGEQYSLEQLREKYRTETNTDKVILINPDDWNVKVEEKFQPEKSAELIYILYTKTSLSAAILASAKHELILSTIETNYTIIDNFLESKLTNINYLTIMATPNAIAYREKMWEYSAWHHIYRALDQTQYADINGDMIPDIAVGRIMGISSSDVSSYVARVLFYDTFSKTNNMKFMATGDPTMPVYYYVVDQAKRWVSKFSEAGYNAIADTYDDYTHDFNPVEWDDQDLISYQDHGSSSWAGISSSNIPLLESSIIFNDACSTCSTYSGSSFCNRAIRQGALAHMGAVSVAFTGTEVYKKTMNGIYYYGLTLGKAFQKAFDYTYKDNPGNYKYRYMTTLIGDPTLDINPVYSLTQPLCGRFGGGGVEICDNSIDDDCDDEIDEEDCENHCYVDTACGLAGNCQDCTIIPAVDLTCGGGKVYGHKFRCGGSHAGCVRDQIRVVLHDCDYGCSEERGAHCMSVEEFDRELPCDDTDQNCEVNGECRNCTLIPAVDLTCRWDNVYGHHFKCGDGVCTQKRLLKPVGEDCPNGCSLRMGAHCTICEGTDTNCEHGDCINCLDLPAEDLICRWGNVRGKKLECTETGCQPKSTRDKVEECPKDCTNGVCTCLPSGTEVNILNQGTCCNGWGLSYIDTGDCRWRATSRGSPCGQNRRGKDNKWLKQESIKKCV